MNPTVSIVIPTYNGEAFLPDTLDSIRAQTFTDWEIIAVDDGSSDGTVDLLRANAGERMTVLEQSNAGSSAARQRGREHSRGRYLIFLDHDDRLVNDALARFVTVLDADPGVAVAYGDRVFIDPQGNRFGSERGPVFRKRPSGDVFFASLEKQFITTPGQGCISLRHLDAIGPIPQPPKLGGDWALWCLLATQGTFVFVGHGPTIEYRQHPGSKMKKSVDRTAVGLDIAELEPANDYVFGHELCRAKAAGRWETAKRRRQAHCYAIKGDQFLNEGNIKQARLYFRRALALNWRQPRSLVVMALSYLIGFPAPVRRIMGVYGR